LWLSGYNNNKVKYVLGNHELKELTVERDLGVFVQNDRCISSAVRLLLGMINRNFTIKSKSIILPLYKALVRPHLDYAID